MRINARVKEVGNFVPRKIVMIVKREKRFETPIVDFLLSNARDLYANFHALPISHLKPGEKGYERFKEIYGCKYLSLESTATGKVFDSFFYPEKAIKRAQLYAAELFRSKETLFGTCGTSISNYIVVDALVKEGSRVLLDRESHQSMHFSVNNQKANVDYFYSEQYCIRTGRKYLKIEHLIEKVETAVRENRHYSVVILNACSYDGVVCNVYEVIKRIVDISPQTTFIVDEAWTSAFYFHQDLFKYTAGYAAEKLKNRVDIVSTQSAHKSLMSLRQASMIHVFAKETIIDQIYRSRFKYHSSSPNYPILASIDAARSHMQSYGRDLLDRAMLYAKTLRKSLLDDPLLSDYLYLNSGKNAFGESGGICIEDPLRIHLNISHTGMSGAEMQEHMYNNYGIYLNRYTVDTVLISIHIGIGENHIKHLLNSLKALNGRRRFKPGSVFEKNDFIISYPPGVPIYAPGESFGNALDLEIKSRMNAGSSVFSVN